MNDPTATTATDPSAPTTEASTTGEDLATVIRQRDEYLDKLQRAHADFVNYQKRAKLQADADRIYLVKPLALDILNALDNFDRAIETARSGGAQAVAEGLMMVEKQFVDALAKHGVEAIPALGQPFDPNFHEAIMQRPDAHHPEGTVVMELARGYKLGDRVIRPSKVAVSIATAE
jgi:molecular chaperone GrpE